MRTAVPTLVCMHRLREPGYVQASPGGRQPARTLPPFLLFSEVKHENRAGFLEAAGQAELAAGRAEAAIGPAGRNDALHIPERPEHLSHLASATLATRTQT